MLETFASSRENNLNLIRILAALAVLVSHAYPLSLGPDTQEPFEALLGYNLGRLALYIFFAASGFLIAASYVRSRTVVDWAAARALRLFPALAVVLCLTVLALGPIMTTLPLSTYFTDPAVAGYVPSNLRLFFREESLPGVFATTPFPDMVNGSIWTLGYEVICYIGVLALGLTGAFSHRARMVALLAGYFAIYGVCAALVREGVITEFKMRALIELSYPFVVGVTLYAARRAIPLNGLVAATLLGASWLAHGSPVFFEVSVVAIAYLVFYVANWDMALLRRYNRVGDYSYGVYIYAWPMQQLAAEFGAVTPFQNIALAMPMTLVLAILSWVLVERPALALKPVMATALRGVAETVSRRRTALRA